LTEIFLIQRRINLEQKQKKEEKFRAQISECDQKIFKKQHERSDKFYNITQTTHILGVHRQAIYYWINKRWVKPKKDYRSRDNKKRPRSFSQGNRKPRRR